jgi:hypothetical protein
MQSCLLAIGERFYFWASDIMRLQVVGGPETMR